MDQDRDFYALHILQDMVYFIDLLGDYLDWDDVVQVGQDAVEHYRTIFPGSKLDDGRKTPLEVERVYREGKIDTRTRNCAKRAISMTYWKDSLGLDPNNFNQFCELVRSKEILGARGLGIKALDSIAKAFDIDI